MMSLRFSQMIIIYNKYVLAWSIKYKRDLANIHQVGTRAWFSRRVYKWVVCLCSGNKAFSGGHLLIACELEQSVVKSVNDLAAPITAPLIKQLASLSSQVAGVGINDSSSQLQLPVETDGLYNYAPLCAFLHLYNFVVSSSRAGSSYGNLHERALCSKMQTRFNYLKIWLVFNLL